MKEYLLDIHALVRKEGLMIIKDKRTRFILIVPVIVQCLLFGYVATYDLNRVDYVLLDEDRTFSSQELAADFDGSGIFQRVARLDNSAQIAPTLDNREALLVVHIGPQFERRLNAGQSVPVQIIVDGRNSNVAGIASSYANRIIETFNANRLRERGVQAPEIRVSSRAWHNPNLETRWNIISGMLAVLSVVQVLILSGQSVAREKEQGTFDQLLVTPYGPLAIMFGKALPPVMIGLAQASIVLLIGLYWFKIPYAGSYAVLYLGLLLFNFTIVGIGLCISALTATMQQALLFSFTLLMPMILLSGFATPIESMPEGLQIATLLNPVRYGVEFTQRIYLEGAALGDIYGTFWLLALMSVITLGAASRLFRSHLGGG